MKALLKRLFPNLFSAYRIWQVGGFVAGLNSLITVIRFWIGGRWNWASRLFKGIVNFFRSKQIAILAIVTTILVLVGLATPEVGATSSIIASRLFEMLMKWNFLLVPSFIGYALYYAFAGHKISGVEVAPLSAEWERKNRLMANYIIGAMLAWALQLRL